MRTIFAAVALAAAVSFSAWATAAAPAKVVSEAASLPPGYSHMIVHSEKVGRDFEVWVNVPQATAFLPGQKFPAIYALDGGYGIAGPQGTLLGGTGAMSPAIIVSVAAASAPGLYRNTDLLHNKLTQNGTTIGGGGAAFEAFLQEELKPLIEARYPADPARSILFGHSFGGLFAANVFADDPDAWAGYIIGSASAWADPSLVARVATAAPKAHGVRVYLTVGEDEDSVALTGDARMRKGYLALAAALKGHPGVTLKTEMYLGESHLSYYPRLITDGFPFVLPPARPMAAAQTKVTPAALARYGGVYKMPDGRQLRVFTGPNGAMAAQVTGIAPVPLMANGPDRFYNPTSDIQAVFDGQSLTMTAGGGAKLKIPRDTAPWAGGGPVAP